MYKVAWGQWANRVRTVTDRSWYAWKPASDSPCPWVRWQYSWNSILDQRSGDNSTGNDFGNRCWVLKSSMRLLAEGGRGKLGRILVYYPGLLDLSYSTSSGRTIRCYSSITLRTAIPSLRHSPSLACSWVGSAPKRLYQDPARLLRWPPISNKKSTNSRANWCSKMWSRSDGFKFNCTVFVLFYGITARTTILAICGPASIPPHVRYYSWTWFKLAAPLADSPSFVTRYRPISRPFLPIQAYV